jgi:hypothetical protein
MIVLEGEVKLQIDVGIGVMIIINGMEQNVEKKIVVMMILCQCQKRVLLLQVVMQHELIRVIYIVEERSLVRPDVIINVM